MKDLSQIIANLTPEKRDALLQKLRSSQGGNTTILTKKEVVEEAIEEGDNFYMAISSPGNLQSIKQIKQAILPPRFDQVQIKVKAASLNFRDLMMALNMYPATPGVASVMGSDFSGIITAVGEEITEYKIGDEVICLSAGSLTHEESLDPDSHFAAYTNIKSNQVTKKPKNISWEEAACLPTVFLTSYYSLMNIANLKKGERVLIHTASGGVGQSAIQIAKWMKAEIFVTAGTDLKRDFLKSIDFEAPMDSRSLVFEKQIMERTNNEGIDVILNTIAGEAGDAGLRILRDFGRFVQIDKKDIANNNTIQLGEFNKGLSYCAFDLGLFYLNPELMKQLFDKVSNHFRDENFKPITYNSYNIKDLGAAFIEFSRAQHIGKIVLTY